MLRPAPWAVPGVVLAACIALLAAARPPMLYSDPAVQLLSAQQFAAGLSASPNHLLGPLAEDLSMTVSRWIIWWPAGLSFVVAPLLILGAPVGVAVRVLSILLYGFGVAGWYRWTRRFQLPNAVAGLVFLAYVLHRFATQPLVQFYAEAFVFAGLPWALLSTLSLRTKSTPLSGVTGLGIGGLAWLKYSLAIVGVGCCLFAWSRARRSGSARGALVFTLGVVSAIAALFAMNAVLGGTSSSIVASRGFHPAWSDAWHALVSTGLMLGDAQPVLDRIAWQRPDFEWVRALGWVWIVAGLLAGWSCWKQRETAEGALSGCMMVAVCASLTVIWMVSGAASHEPRHAAAAALPVLPVIASVALSGSRSSWIFIGVVALSIAMPIAAAAFMFPAKMLRSRGDAATPQWLYNPAISPSAGRAGAVALQQATAGCDVVVVPDPVTAIDLPDANKVVLSAEFQAPEELRADFHARSPVVTCAITNSFLEHSGRADAIRLGFGRVAWSRIDVSDTQLIVWRGTAFR